MRVRNHGVLLCNGRFCSIFLTRGRSSKLIAVKVFQKSSLPTTKKAEISCEVNALRFLRCHPNIIQLYGYSHNVVNLCMYMEFVPGNLFALLLVQPNYQFDENRTISYVNQIVDALLFCHRYGIIHRDLKLENVLLNNAGVIKVAGFEWSVRTPFSRRSTFTGAFDHLPPEMLEGKTCAYQVDLWSLGILCYLCLFGRTPFQGKTSAETYRKILRANYCFPPTVSKGAREFISLLLIKEPTRRLCFHNILEHPWLKKRVMKHTQNLR